MSNAAYIFYGHNISRVKDSDNIKDNIRHLFVAEIMILKKGRISFINQQHNLTYKLINEV